MKSTRITSREYKLTLKPGLFSGPARKRGVASSRFMRDVARVASALGIRTRGRLDTAKAPRLIGFMDTADATIGSTGYILRERRDLESGQRELTLKFRHPDRYVTEGHVVRGGETKFEEDIKPGFQSLYSFSQSVAVDHEAALSTLRDAIDIFPALGAHVKKQTRSAAIHLVNDFLAHEEVLTGHELHLDREEAESALIFWYDSRSSRVRPLIVEFSFRYGDKKGDYSASVSIDAFRLYTAIQKELSAWLDPARQTKTALALGQ